MGERGTGWRREAIGNFRVFGVVVQHWSGLAAALGPHFPSDKTPVRRCHDICRAECACVRRVACVCKLCCVRLKRESSARGYLCHCRCNRHPLPFGAVSICFFDVIVFGLTRSVAFLTKNNGSSPYTLPVQFFFVCTRFGTESRRVHQ